MNRREALRQLGQAAGALAIWRTLPVASWAALGDSAGWSSHEVDLLTIVGDTIIPSTADSAGAGAIHIGRFVVMMLEECHPRAAAEQVRAFLGRLDSRDGNGREPPFVQRSPADQEKLLTELEARTIDAGSTEPWADGWRLVKRLTLLGYFTSEPGATKALHYDPVPGAYRGSVPAGPTTKAWAT